MTQHGSPSLSAQAERPFAKAVRLLREANLRPSQQRLGLARLLFDGEKPRHLSAETLLSEAQKAGLKVSLATVYNTLHGFTEAGLLRAIHVAPGRTVFDTNTSAHHHFYNVDDGTLTDIPAGNVRIEGLPEAPEGLETQDVEVVVRVRNRPIS